MLTCGRQHSTDTTNVRLPILLSGALSSFVWRQCLPNTPALPHNLQIWTYFLHLIWGTKSSEVFWVIFLLFLSCFINTFPHNVYKTPHSSISNGIILYFGWCNEAISNYVGRAKMQLGSFCAIFLHKSIHFLRIQIFRRDLDAITY